VARVHYLPTSRSLDAPTKESQNGAPVIVLRHVGDFWLCEKILEGVRRNLIDAKIPDAVGEDVNEDSQAAAEVRAQGAVSAPVPAGNVVQPFLELLDGFVNPRRLGHRFLLSMLEPMVNGTRKIVVFR